MKQFTLVIGNKNYSSWSLRPWLLMKQAEIDFEEIRIPLHQANTDSEIAKYSAAGKVPILIHGEITLWESLSICEYIAERFAKVHLWPQDAKVRAIARSVASEMHAGFQALRQNMPMDVRASYPGKGMAADVQDDIDRITDIWKDCLKKFGYGGKFLFGRFTVADAMFAPVVLRFKTYAVKVDPISEAYMKNILSLPAMEEWCKAARQEVETISH